MWVLADIGGWQMVKIFLASLPEITAWIASLAGVGLVLGTLLLMVSLRWMLPWSSLHELRQARHGWFWFCLQWGWVCLWGLALPALGMTTGALVGSAIGARTLVLRENVGQVVGERVLAPISVQLAAELQKHYPTYGDIGHSKIETKRLRVLLEGLTPQLLESALKDVRMLDERATDVSGMELAGRRFARQAIHRAGQHYFKSKTVFVDDVLSEFHRRQQEQVYLKDVVACACHLYFTPAFAEWTYAWVISHAFALLPIIAAIWLLPWAIFALFWWWRNRQARLLPALQHTEGAGLE